MSGKSAAPAAAWAEDAIDDRESPARVGDARQRAS